MYTVGLMGRGCAALNGGWLIDLPDVKATWLFPPLEVVDLLMGEADASRCVFKALDLTICLRSGSSLVMIEAMVVTN